MAWAVFDMRDQVGVVAGGWARAKLVEDPALRRRMGAAAREHAERTHLWSARVEQLSALYEELVPQPA